MDESQILLEEIGSRPAKTMPILQEEPASSVRLVEQMHKGQIREFREALLWLVRRLTADELSKLYLDVRNDKDLPRARKDIVNSVINMEDERRKAEEQRRKTESLPKN